MSDRRPAPQPLDGPLVTTEWLAGQLGAEDLRIVDCSVVMRTTEDGGYSFVGGADEWQAGHIPGAGFVDVLAELADPGQALPMMMPQPDHFAAAMGRLGIGPGTRVVLYDRSNHAWAARVWWMLRVHGFDDAAVLDGGWQKWAAEGRPQATDGAPAHSAHFEVRLRPELVATKGDVMAAIGADDITVINSLSPEEHSGSATRFPRAGRIPGSVNVYCQQLVDPERHHYLPADELQALFDRVGARSEAARTITYCGAGIAASSDALALTLLGFDNVAVYDGSLAEWTADPDLPLEAD